MTAATSASGINTAGAAPVASPVSAPVAEVTDNKYTVQQWTEKFNDIKFAKADLNVIVMNYLIVQGYQGAAIQFSREANISPSIESAESIEQRRQIRCDIYRGDIQHAIASINELNPFVRRKSVNRKLT